MNDKPTVEELLSKATGYAHFAAQHLVDEELSSKPAVDCEEGEQSYEEAVIRLTFRFIFPSASPQFIETLVALDYAARGLNRVVNTPTQDAARERATRSLEQAYNEAFDHLRLCAKDETFTPLQQEFLDSDLFKIKFKG